MAKRKLYLGSVGPFWYDDAALVNDPDGDFPAQTQTAIMTDGELFANNIVASMSTVQKNNDYTVLDDDRVNFIFVTAGALNRSITLPTALANEGRVISIKKVDSGIGYVIVDGEGAETIDGSLTKTLKYQYDTLTIRAELGSWYVVSEVGSNPGNVRRLSVVDITNPSEINLLDGLIGDLVLCYEVKAAAIRDEYTLYTYDASGPAVNAPFIMDALGVGAERWIAIGGKFSVYTLSILSLVYPVGSIYISIIATNPFTVFGFGTWVAFGTGRVLVGIDGGDADFDVVEETGGNKTRTPNAHGGTAIDPHSGTAVANHTAVGGIQGALPGDVVTTADHSVTQPVDHIVTQPSNHAAISVVQPYIVVYMWKRTV